MSSEINRATTGKFFTSARKVQQLLGTLPDGRKIPGGPYTLPQVLTGLGAGLLAFLTRPMWTKDVVTDVLIVVGVTVGVGWAAGRIPRTRRTLIGLVNSTLNLLTRPVSGKYRGRKVTAAFSASRIKKDAKERKARAKKNPLQQPQAPEAREAPEPQINSGLDRLLADTQ